MQGDEAVTLSPRLFNSRFQIVRIRNDAPGVALPRGFRNEDLKFTPLPKSRTFVPDPTSDALFPHNSSLRVSRPHGGSEQAAPIRWKRPKRTEGGRNAVELQLRAKRVSGERNAAMAHNLVEDAVLEESSRNAGLPGVRGAPMGLISTRERPKRHLYRHMAIQELLMTTENSTHQP